MFVAPTDDAAATRGVVPYTGYEHRRVSKVEVAEVDTENTYRGCKGVV